MGLPTEQIGMSACLEEEERKFVVMLLPGHQPIRLYVALPLPLVVTFQEVRLVLSRQRAIFRQ